MKIPNHKLTLEWSQEYGVESSSTASCTCGWQESASNQVECRHEYIQHLKRVSYLEQNLANENVNYWHGLMETASRRRMSEDQVKILYIKALRGNKLPPWTERLDKFSDHIKKVRSGIHTDWHNS